MPEISKIWTLSTCHITQEDSEKMLDCSLITYDLEGYGWLVYIPSSDIIDNYGKDVSPALQKILGLAKDLGCTWIKFDRDGPEEESLTQFNW